MKDTFKAIVWGGALLCLIATTLITLFGLFINIDHRISEKERLANEAVYEKLNPLLKDLEKVFYNAPSNQTYELRQDPQVEKAIKFIGKTVDDCEDCSTIRTPYFSGWIDFSQFADKLDNLSDKEHVSDINIASTVLSLFAGAAVALGIYLLVSLFKYKSLHADGLLALFLFLLPIYVITVSGSMAMSFKPDNSYYHVNDVAAGTFFYTFLALFLIYPPAFIYCKKRGIKISRLMKFDLYK